MSKKYSAHKTFNINFEFCAVCSSGTVKNGDRKNLTLSSVKSVLLRFTVLDLG